MNASPAVIMDVDWNYAVPSNLDDVCKVLRRRIEVHQQWADYLDAYPSEDYAKDAIKAGIGEAANHRLYISQYEAAINLITQAKSED